MQLSQVSSGASPGANLAKLHKLLAGLAVFGFPVLFQSHAPSISGISDLCRPGKYTKCRQRFIRGTTAALRSWLLNRGLPPHLLCKFFSCQAYPGSNAAVYYIVVENEKVLGVVNIAIYSASCVELTPLPVVCSSMRAANTTGRLPIEA